MLKSTKKSTYIDILQTTLYKMTINSTVNDTFFSPCYYHWFPCHFNHEFHEFLLCKRTSSSDIFFCNSYFSILPDEVHALPGLILREFGIAGMDILEHPSHVACKGAHGLHTLGVETRLTLFATIHYVPIL